jgi:predicted nucleic-acid-binding Zn-ribbon protein
LGSIYGDKLIHGSHLDRDELQTALKQILQTFTEKDFLSVFCTRYGYEELPNSDTVRVDYIIDLDTHLLIKPKY